MVKVDFSKIAVTGIDGNIFTADFGKAIGNQLYMQGHDIEECELGKRIYFADGDVELSDKDCNIVRQAIQGYSYVARTSIERAMLATE